MDAVGRSAAPIDASNIGHQSESRESQLAPPQLTTAFPSAVLTSMGWTPGSGLGRDLAGIATPIPAYRRSHRRGLGGEG